MKISHIFNDELDGLEAGFRNYKYDMRLLIDLHTRRIKYHEECIEDLIKEIEEDVDKDINYHKECIEDLLKEIKKVRERMRKRFNEYLDLKHNIITKKKKRNEPCSAKPCLIIN